ncbi:MAG TPA: hypothetical protein PK228_21555, partial [Saprospiraceae bacterium]|nr:hypothetical protein [Saprospiraceae bacterium]
MKINIFLLCLALSASACYRKTDSVTKTRNPSEHVAELAPPPDMEMNMYSVETGPAPRPSRSSTRFVPPVVKAHDE